MRTMIGAATIMLLVAVASPGQAFFLDYLFGGSNTSDSIDNSAVGDLRAWWTGNPVYQFNPYYRGSADPAHQAQANNQMGAAQGSYQPQPQPSVNYFPPQSQQQYGYSGYTPGTEQYEAGQPLQYQTQQPQYYQQPAAQYQPPAPQYQQQSGYAQAPPQYSYQQQAPQQYQAAPQSYQHQYPGGYGQ